jgi:hypothetical protein
VNTDLTCVLDEYDVTLDEATQIAAEMREPDGTHTLTIRDGRLYADDRDAGLITAVLRETANARRELAVEAADKALVAAEGTFRQALRSHDNNRKLRALKAVTDAIVALCDAKQAAGQFSPGHADRVRVEARQQHEDAVRSIRTVTQRSIRKHR